MSRRPLSRHLAAIIPTPPRHGVNALGHGYTSACDYYGETCNNGACRLLLDHDRCTEECSAIVVRDENGCPWAPDAPHLAAIVPTLPEPAPTPMPTCARCGDPDSAEYEICRDVAQGGGIEVFSDARGELIAKYCEFRGAECTRKPICGGCWNNLYDGTPVESWWPAEAPGAGA